MCFCPTSGFVLRGQRCRIHLFPYSASRELRWASGFVKNTPCWTQIGVIHFTANPSIVGLSVCYGCPIRLISGWPTLKMDDLGSSCDMSWPPPTTPTKSVQHLFCISVLPDSDGICHLCGRCEGHLRFPGSRGSACHSACQCVSCTEAASSDSEFHYVLSTGDSTKSNKFISLC